MQRLKNAAIAGRGQKGAQSLPAAKMRQAGLARRGLVALLAASAVAMLGVAPQAALGATAGDILASGATLTGGSTIVSNNGQYRLAMQRNGDLVLYHVNSPTWAIDPKGAAGAHVTMQKDGNFVLYLGTRPLWATGTDRSGDAGASIVVQDDGDLAVYSVGHVVLWQTARPSSTLKAGQSLVGGSCLISLDKAYALCMQRNGDLVLYHGRSPIWAIDPRGAAGDLVTMQSDGNFVLYLGHRALWASGTDRSGDAGASIVVLDSGTATIYSSSRQILWSTTPYHPVVQIGDSGTAVLDLQRRLTALGYWLGSPDGYFGDSTQQAVFALQKAAGLSRDGVVGPSTWAALTRGAEPTPRAASGDLIEVNLSTDLLMFIRNGKLWNTINTSTGGGYTYTSQGVTSVAITPQGVFNTFYAIDGTDTDALGTLWRPRFFEGGYAIHGDSYVPAVPVSHGCVRVSDEAINWIWAENLDPIGEEVWIYS